MNIFATLRAIRDLHDVPAAHKAILYAMVLRTDGQTGECWPSYPTLAADAGVSLALAKRAVKELERAGLIAVNRRHVDGTRWSLVNRYVVLVRHDPASARDDTVRPKDSVVSALADVVSPGHDIVSQGDHVVRGYQDNRTALDEEDSESPPTRPNSVPEGMTASAPDVVSRDDQVVDERNDGRISARREVVSMRHEGRISPTREVVSTRYEDRISPTREVVSTRHEGRVTLTREVVSTPHEGRVTLTPNLPNELPNGRTFALTRSDDPLGGSVPRSKRPPKHPPELIAAKNAVVTEFVLRCEATKGARPKKIHERDHAAAFALAKTYGADEGRTIVRRAFEDDFVVTKNTTLAFIESKAETYRGKVVRKSQGAREIQGLVGDEPWLKEHCP